MEIIESHALDVSETGKCNDRILSRNQRLVAEILRIKLDGCSPLVAVFVPDENDLIANDAQKNLLVTEDCFVLGNLLLQLVILLLQFLSFQTGKSTQTHIHDGLSLRFRKCKGFDEAFSGFRHVFGRADDPDDLVNDIQRLQQALQNVGSFSRLV